MYRALFFIPCDSLKNIGKSINPFFSLAFLAPNGCHLRRWAEPNRGERPMWVERCAVAARNPEPIKYQVTKQPSNQVLKGEA